MTNEHKKRQLTSYAIREWKLQQLHTELLEWLTPRRQTKKQPVPASVEGSKNSDLSLLGMQNGTAVLQDSLVGAYCLAWF